MQIEDARVAGSYALRSWFGSDEDANRHVHQLRYMEKLVNGTLIPDPDLGAQYYRRERPDKLAPSTCRVHATILGAPSCGKTSYCTEIVRRLGRSAIAHVSGGDFHRAATASEELEGYGDGRLLNSLRCEEDEHAKIYDSQLTRFIYECHNTSLQLIDGERVRAVLSDLKDIEQSLLLEQHVLSALEGRAGAAISYDVVFIVECSLATLLDRIRSRPERAGDWNSEEERLRKWYVPALLVPTLFDETALFSLYLVCGCAVCVHVQLSMCVCARTRAVWRVATVCRYSTSEGVYKGDRDRKIAEYKRTHQQTTTVVRLDGERSIGAIVDDMEAELRAVASRKGMPFAENVAPSSTPATDARRASERLRQVLNQTWRSGGYAEILARAPASAHARARSRAVADRGRGGGRVQPQRGHD